MRFIDFRSLANLAAVGFRGNVRVKNCPAALSKVPQEPGVYVVGRKPDEFPEFVGLGRSHQLKHKKTAVNYRRLVWKWCDPAEVLYIGESHDLHERLHTLFGSGKVHYLPQWGGRYLWHLKDAAQLRLYWQATADYRERKTELLGAFKWQFMKLPFANLKVSSPDLD